MMRICSEKRFFQMKISTLLYFASLIGVFTNISQSYRPSAFHRPAVGWASPKFSSTIISVRKSLHGSTSWSHTINLNHLRMRTYHHPADECRSSPRQLWPTSRKLSWINSFLHGTFSFFKFLFQLIFGIQPQTVEIPESICSSSNQTSVANHITDTNTEDSDSEIVISTKPLPTKHLSSLYLELHSETVPFPALAPGTSIDEAEKERIALGKKYVENKLRELDELSKQTGIKKDEQITAVEKIEEQSNNGAMVHATPRYIPVPRNTWRSLRSVPKEYLNGKIVMVRSDLHDVLHNNSTGFNATIHHLINCGAKILVVASGGDATGLGYQEEYSFESCVPQLSRELNKTVKFVPDCIGVSVAAAVQNMNHGDVSLLENLAFYGEEELHDSYFVRSLAEHVDVFINDDCSSIFSNHSSVVNVGDFVNMTGVGFSFFTNMENILPPEIAFFNEGSLKDVFEWLHSNGSFPEKLVMSLSSLDPWTTSNSTYTTNLENILLLAREKNIDVIFASDEGNITDSSNHVLNGSAQTLSEIQAAIPNNVTVTRLTFLV